MKKKCPPNVLAADAIAFLAAVVFSIPVPASANAELDRRFSLDTVGVLKSWDNMDGLFAEYVLATYKEYFARQSRFVLQDVSKADAVLAKSKLPYYKIVDDVEVLGQLARSMRTETLIRTKVYKEGPKYRFTIDWLHAPRMEVLASDSVTLEEPRGGKALGMTEFREALHKTLDGMIKKVPFSANVTGRDEESVTVNLGANDGIRQGDTIVVGTLDEVKKHPLLGAIVDWRLTRTGKLVVESTDEGMAFCKLSEEESGRQVARFQKVIQVLPKQELVQAPIETDESERAAMLAERPSLGWGAGNLWVGGFSRQYSSVATGTEVGKTGGGMLIGGKADGQLWFTREWFGELAMAYGYSGLSQTDISSGTATAATGATASVFQIRLDAGYTYFTTLDMFGPKAWAKLGYQTSRYELPISTTESTGPISFTGPFIGLGADLPIRSKLGVILTFDFGLLTSAEEIGLNSGDPSGETAVNFFVGAYYRFEPRMSLRAGFDVFAHGSDFSGGASVTHRVISFAPSLQYYF